MSNSHGNSDTVETAIELAQPRISSIPSDQQTPTQLEVQLVSGKTRSKMRILAILIALYVWRYCPIGAFSHSPITKSY